MSPLFPRLCRATAALALIVLAACSSPPAPQFPEITFSHLPPITLNVAQIEIINNLKPATDANHVEARMPTSPETAMRNWARDRLRAGGVTGVAKFIIENASVTETNLPKMGGIKGYVTNEQAERYEARARATIRLEGVPRVSEAYAEAEVDRTQTVPENATVNTREKVWFELTETLMKDFDPVMASSIRQHLGDLVR